MNRLGNRPRRWSWLLAGLAAGLFVVAGCSDQRGLCDFATCPTGCCDANQQCRLGNENAFCGAGGEQCESCAVGSGCRGNRCVFQPGDCNIQTCSSGCCKNGICEPGNRNDGCGTGGVSCDTCQANETCTDSVCVKKTCQQGCTLGCCFAGFCELGNFGQMCGTGGVSCSVCVGGQECINRRCQ